MRTRYLAAAAVAALAAAAFLWWSVRRANLTATVAEFLRAKLPYRLARWADPIADAAVKTVPADFPGEAQAWALLAASVMDEESLGGEAPGYSPQGVWNGSGDSGNALTPWQLDKRYHGKYLLRLDRTPESDSAYALALLADNWKAFSALTDADLQLKAAVAAYNASRTRVQAALDAGNDPDLATYPRARGQVYASEIVARFGNWSAA